MSKKLFLIIGTLITLGIAGYFIYTALATSNPHQWTNGLVGYWSFDGQYTTSTDGTRDVPNNGNYGQFNGGVKPVAGISGQALSFDGTDDYVNAGNGASLDFGANPFTIELWIKPNSLVHNPFIGKGQAGIGTNIGTVARIEDVTYKVRWFVRGNSEVSAYSAGALATGSWYHIVLVKTSTMVVYVNAVAGPSQTAPTGSINSTETLRIGQYGENPQYFNGLIDEVRIYNRALSADEVKQHYDQTRRNFVVNNPSGTPPVGWWKMDGGNGSATARDYSVNANNGTLYGEMATSTTYGWVDGKIGKALSFDGVDDYVSVTHSASLLPSNYTIESWVKLNVVGTAEQAIISKGDPGAEGYHLHYYTGGQKIFFAMHGGLDPAIAHGTTLPVAGTWYYVVSTYDGTNLKIYVNGILEDTQVLAAYNSNTDPVKFGAADTYGQYFNGLIDDVRIYNYARTADQIAADFRAGAYRTIVNTSVPSTWWTSGLVGYWNFDGPNTTSTNGTRDASGNNNWGAFNGGVKPVAGISGQALSFDGVDDYVDVPNISQSQFTWEAWIKSNNVANNDPTVISYSVSHELGHRDSKIYFWCSSWCSGSEISGVTTIINNQWYHFVATFDGITVTLYLNGQYENSKAVTRTPSGDLRVGRDYLNNYWDGLIDEVRIYNRALSADEVMEHYQQTRRNLGI